MRRHADAVHDALNGEEIITFTTRMKLAKAWLSERDNPFLGRRVIRVYSRGKNLIGEVDGGLFFYSHLMMWGRWQVMASLSPWDVDRRERARIGGAGGGGAILYSAPVFEVGEGDPFVVKPYLASLGPDILPYPGESPFGAACFEERLRHEGTRTIGAALLDQTVAAGIGNYLRAEILFLCRLDPFRAVETLSEGEVGFLSRTLPELACHAYEYNGLTVTLAEQERMREDASLRYPNSSAEWGGRHYVFRRTNLPCLVCGTPIKQRKQVTHIKDDGEEKERIIYFCPQCQEVDLT